MQEASLPNQAGDGEQRMLAVIRSPLMRSLPAETQQALSGHLEPVRLSKGDSLFLQGDPSDALYLVDSGSVQVLREGPGGEQRVLAVLGPGDVVGEMGVLDALPRSATCRAAQPSCVWRLSRSAFFDLALQDPRLYLVLVQVRMRRSSGSGLAMESSGQDFDDRVERVVRVIRRLVLAGSTADASGARRLRVTPEELASLAGTSPEALGLILAHLESLGVIVRRGHASMWVDPKRLMAGSDESVPV